jgi:hypothetical protein
LDRGVVVNQHLSDIAFDQRAHRSVVGLDKGVISALETLPVDPPERHADPDPQGHEDHRGNGEPTIFQGLEHGGDALVKTGLSSPT